MTPLSNSGTGIIQTTPHGYRANDARFLAGAILWRQHQSLDALRMWRDIRGDPTHRYATASAELLALLAMPETMVLDDDAAVERLLDSRIRRILAAEHSRWVSFSTGRLLRFGYQLDSY